MMTRMTTEPEKGPTPGKLIEVTSQDDIKANVNSPSHIYVS